MISWWVIAGACLLAFCIGFVQAGESEKIDTEKD